MTKEQKANKEAEVLAWMTKEGYDRKAAQMVAPVVVKYLDDHSVELRLNNSLPKWEFGDRVKVFDQEDREWGFGSVVSNKNDKVTVKWDDLHTTTIHALDEWIRFKKAK